MKCRVCGGRVKTFFDLGRQPLANSLLENPRQSEKKYPLALNHCSYCGSVQLNYTVNPKTLFSKYVWVTGTSSTARSFSNVFYKELARRTPDSRKNYVLEVASNDGTFLLPFSKRGYRVIGLDPAANIAKIAEKNGVPTKVAFWGPKAAKKILNERGPARIIFARNVLAHVANLQDFVKGLALCLHEDGVLAIEVHYAAKILKELQYDSIYHEHLCYFTFGPLERLLKQS
ncbi:MAG: methyltransferase domain-containing protein, partial [Patescibacteria group bacterium]